jgi:predicted heme/steroid binding protein
MLLELIFMKKLWVFLSLLVAVFVLVACNDDNTIDNSNTEDLIEFTLEDLAEFDGLDGRDAYIAVDGYVYDVTESNLWRDGSHQGAVQAGQDLTDELDSISPHGREMLDRVPRIGIIVDEVQTTEEVTTEVPTTELPTTIEQTTQAPTTTQVPTTTMVETSETMRVFTLEELAMYDGLDGQDAYIAVDGIVYDVTNSSLWTDGNHQGRVQAGQDLTTEIDTISPHGRRVLDNVPIIGTLAEEE